jgi:hypothetical protein
MIATGTKPTAAGIAAAFNAGAIPHPVHLSDGNEAELIASSLLSEALMPIPFEDFKKQEIKEEYLGRLINEVYRVTETVCLGFELCRLAQKYAESAGFSVLRYASVGLAPTEDASLEDFFILQKGKLAEGRLK